MDMKIANIVVVKDMGEFVWWYSCTFTSTTNIIIIIQKSGVGKLQSRNNNSLGIDV